MLASNEASATAGESVKCHWILKLIAMFPNPEIIIYDHGGKGEVDFSTER